MHYFSFQVGRFTRVNAYGVGRTGNIVALICMPVKTVAPRVWSDFSPDEHAPVTCALLKSSRSTENKKKKTITTAPYPKKKPKY